MNRPQHHYPEPVPEVTQLAAMSFLSAVDGYIKDLAKASFRRTTLHRLMASEDLGYLQQMCSYFGTSGFIQKNTGRMFPADFGIMGKSFAEKKIMRTKHYPGLKELRADLSLDMRDTGDGRNIEQIPASFLAIPFLDSSEEVVLVFYSECDEVNFFADSGKLRQLLSMCQSFCDFCDWVADSQPFSGIRNFPLSVESISKDMPTVYPRLQEIVETSPPRMKNISSFNFEVLVA